MEAIVYTSNTGSSRSYADMLSEKPGIMAYSYEQAKKELPLGIDIIYIGWINAGKIKGYSKAKSDFNIRILCGVGMGKIGTQEGEIRKKNDVSDDIALFTLQGNFDIEKLHGLYKIMMSVMAKAVKKDLMNKENRTQEENDILDMVINGKNRVKLENLKDVILYYNNQNQ